MKPILLLAVLSAGCEITIEPMPPPAQPAPPAQVIVVTPPPPPPSGSLTVLWAFQGASMTTSDCDLVNAGRMEVVVWDVWDMPAFDSTELDPPLFCDESGVEIADLEPGDYLIEVWAYDADWGSVTFDGAAGITVEPAGEAWTEVVLERS